MTELDDFFRLLQEKGGARYGGEAVNQLQHALQTALLAEREQADEGLVIAALLHDVGHLVSDDEGLARQGVDAKHEVLGARLLRRFFGPEVTEPIRLHVEAKRFLCTTEPAYGALLSRESVASLKVQGGRLDAAEVKRLESLAHFQSAVALRRWDDEAKDPTVRTRGLSDYHALAETLSRGWRQGRLLLVVGPSGVGKDSLIAAARERLANDSRFHFPLRVVTRVGDLDRELHDSVTQAQFRQMEAAGAFCLSWQAHGFSYGIPASVTGALSRGHRVVINVSRGAIARAAELFPNVKVLHITAEPAAIAARLVARGDSDEAERLTRLERRVTWPADCAEVIEIRNDGPLDQGVTRFLEAVAGP